MLPPQLRIEETKTRPPESFKRLYVVESRRFGGERKPKAAVFHCHSTNRIIVTTAAGRKLNVIALSMSAKAPPVTKKFSFESPVLAVSGCESKFGYSLFVLLEPQSFFVHEDGTTVFLPEFHATVAVLARFSDRHLLLYGGSDQGLLTKADFADTFEAQVVQSVPAASSGIRQLCLADELLACGFVNGTISIFQAATFQQVWTNRFRYGTIRCLAWSPRVDLLAFAGEDDDFYIIDLKQDHEVFRFAGHHSFVSDLSFEVGQADHVRIFSAAEDSICSCWDLVDRQPTQSAMIGPWGTPIRHIACFKKVVLTIDSGGKVVCWRRVKQRADSAP
jgi:WD40 repeat protein